MKRALVSFALLVALAACVKSKKDEPAKKNDPAERQPASAPPSSAAQRTTTIEFNDYVATVELAELASALGAEWQWVDGIRELRGVSVTLAGDVFLVDKNQAVWFLDTSYGILERVAENQDAFRTRLQDPAFAVPLLRMDLVDALRAKGVQTKPGEVYALAVPPSVGGVVSADRVRPIAFRAYLDFVGQLAKGMKALAVGQEFRIKWQGWPGDPEGKYAPNGPLKKHARDRRRFAL